MTNPQDSGNFFASWGFVEFAVAAAWTVVTGLAGFVYRLTMRVGMLEDGAELREVNTERRHKENLAAWDRIDNRVAQLTARLDGVVDRGQNGGIRRY